MAVDKEFPENLQDLVANKIAEKEEIIAIKYKEIISKNEEISQLQQILNNQQNETVKITAGKDEEISCLRQISSNKQWELTKNQI